MLKKERLLRIIERVNKDGIVNISDIVSDFNVSDMTVRRDLDELEQEGLLKRIHGGAQSLTLLKRSEKSNTEKLTLQTEEKEEIAEKTQQFVADGDSIFIGPGTTLEAFARKLTKRHIRVITNSFPIFTILKDSNSVDLILLGGEYRPVTGAFVGSITQKCVESLSFSKAFVSANGINTKKIATYSESEGLIQQLALDQSVEKYLLIDNTKFDKFDFFDFYDLKQLDKIITDSRLSTEQKDAFQVIATKIL